MPRVLLCLFGCASYAVVPLMLLCLLCCGRVSILIIASMMLPSQSNPTYIYCIVTVSLAADLDQNNLSLLVGLGCRFLGSALPVDLGSRLLGKS